MGDWNKSALRTLSRPNFPESAAFVPHAKLRISFVSALSYETIDCRLRQQTYCHV
jgi:hypothetical protein